MTPHPPATKNKNKTRAALRLASAWVVMTFILAAHLYEYNDKAWDDVLRSLLDEIFLEDELVHQYSGSNLRTTLTCHHRNDSAVRDECCGDWDTTSSDEWWTHHADWEISSENDTTYCFSPMQAQKAEFFQNLYNLQWNSNCSEVITSTQINSGYSAAIHWLGYTFLTAHDQKRPFQINFMEERFKPWLYGPSNKSSWAYCDTEDIQCYYLPISSCPRTNITQERQWAEPSREKRRELEFEWLKEYLMRPKQMVRRKLYELRQEVVPAVIPQPCTTLHVRRGDSGLPRKPYRRYASVQEYLDVANVQDGDTVVLLTDDQSTIDEIQEHHRNMAWIYLDRPRMNTIEGGFQNHLPSRDAAADVLAIELELWLGSQCTTVAHGVSGFMKLMRGRMFAAGQDHTAHTINTRVSKDEALKWPSTGHARVQHFQKEMETYRNQSRAGKEKQRRREQQDQQAATPQQQQ